jgi:putative endonuclease
MDRDPFRHEPHPRARGRLGEDLGVEWLRANGFQIVERNVEFKTGEIDVVAREGETLCFIEIKARSTDTYGTAVEAVPAKKQRRVTRAATFYLARNPTEDPCRFDVLAMDLVDDRWSYTLLRDAFSG